MPDAPQTITDWQRVYREEPELYDRLIRGETIHPGVLAALPDVRRCVDVGAGTGRLTSHLARTCVHVVAIEPARGLRETLAERLPMVEVRPGTFDDTGLPDGSMDLVASCSAFTADDRQGGESGLAELERICAPGGTIALVWPSDVDWLCDRGFSYRSFDGEMSVDFGTLEEALELARIFYPGAVDLIAERGSRFVPYEVLGMNAPRDLAWRIKT